MFLMFRESGTGNRCLILLGDQFLYLEQYGTLEEKLLHFILNLDTLFDYEGGKTEMPNLPEVRI